MVATNTLNLKYTNKYQQTHYIMSLNNSGTREETQLPGAFPTEDQVLRDTASNITEAPTPFQTGERDLAQDARNLASGAVTTAAALGLAAKDAAIAAKDAALPVANAASEKVRMHPIFKYYWE